MNDVLHYIEEHYEETLPALDEYVRLPSISAQNQAIPETAAWVERLLQSYGFQTQILPKQPGGNPVVYGELKGASETTLLMYNHYDVQPPEPLELWSSPPFEPTRRDGKIYGRGIADNKSTLIARLLAIRAWQETAGGVPITVKLCIEGDEEIGSPQLGPWIATYGHLLAGAHGGLSEGGSVDWQGRPLISLGVKGILTLGLEVQTAARDVHSSQGAVVPNAAWRLVWALASLKDADETILIDGFYDGIRPVTPEEREAVARLPYEEEATLEALQLPSFLKGVSGTAYYERLIFEPVININGLTAGYQGPGSKTVVPCRATAKLDIRLVPDQNPDDIAAKLRRHLDRQGFQDVVLHVGMGEHPARTRITDPFVKLVRDAARTVYGVEPLVLPNTAGTQPLYYFTEVLKVPMASAGVGYPDGRAHAPDEHIRIEDYVKGAQHVAAIIGGMARGPFAEHNELVEAHRWFR